MNARNDVIILKTKIGETKNQNGFVTQETYYTLQTWGSVKSVWEKEFYDAKAVGIKVDLAVEINVRDYEAATINVNGKKTRPSRLVNEGTEYLIVRTFKKNNDNMELTLQEVE